MTDLTFVYFKMRALGEAPQMMLHFRNQPYRYMMGWEYFGKPWPDAKRGAAFPASFPCWSPRIARKSRIQGRSCAIWPASWT